MIQLDHLDQIIELERGEAGQLWWAIADKARRTLLLAAAQQFPTPVDAALLLALPVLQRTARRLKRIDQRKEHHVGLPRRQPIRFRLRWDELVAIMLYVFTDPISLARVPLGKVQQKSLNLAQWIKF